MLKFRSQEIAEGVGDGLLVSAEIKIFKFSSCPGRPRVPVHAHVSVSFYVPVCVDPFILLAYRKDIERISERHRKGNKSPFKRHRYNSADLDITQLYYWANLRTAGDPIIHIIILCV